MATLAVDRRCTVLRISAELGKSSALFYTEGYTLCKNINRSLIKNEKIELSFEGLKKISTPFLNGLLGFIYYKYPVNVLKNLLHLSGITPELQREIDDVIWKAQNVPFHSELLEDAVSGA